ncbi:hypothetical protein THOM_1436 [Trachipleistophora hominis]|uniref:Uncharacterized protein n=1 Tax=Trachipleistophora hominis TaxID=72359 RepID=L7JWD2_TRAHO|nr:hypothetical protein THOM_1436 [Trachipleistophora hominis]
MLEKEVDDLIFNKKAKKIKPNENAVQYLKYMLRKCPIELEKDQKEMIELQNCITKDYQNDRRARSKSLEDTQRDALISTPVGTGTNAEHIDSVFKRVSTCEPLSPAIKILNDLFVILSKRQAADNEMVDEQLYKLRKEIKNLDREDELKLMHVMNMAKECELESYDYVLVEIMKKDVKVSRSGVIGACEMLVERMNRRSGGRTEENNRKMENEVGRGDKNGIYEEKRSCRKLEKGNNERIENDKNVENGKDVGNKKLESTYNVRYDELTNLILNSFDSFVALKHHGLTIPTYIVVMTQREFEVFADRRVVRECKRNLKMKNARMFYLKYVLLFDKHDIAIFRHCLSDDEIRVMARYGGQRKVFRNFYYKMVKRREWKRLWEFHSKMGGYECDRGDEPYRGPPHGLDTLEKGRITEKGLESNDGTLDDLICINCNHGRPCVLLTLKERIAIVNFIVKNSKIDITVLNLLSIFHYKRLRELCLESVGSDTAFNTQIFQFLKKRNEHNFYVLFLSDQDEVNLRSKDELMQFCHFFMKWRVERWISVNYRYFYVYLNGKNVIDTFIRLIEIVRAELRSNTANKSRTERLRTALTIDEDKIVAWLSLEKMRDKNNVMFYNRLLYLMQLLNIKNIPFLDVLAQYEPYVLNAGCFINYDKFMNRYLNGKEMGVKRLLIASGDERAKEFLGGLVGDLERYGLRDESGHGKENKIDGGCVKKDLGGESGHGKENEIITSISNNECLEDQDGSEDIELPRLHRLPPDYFEYKRKKTYALLITWLYAFPNDYAIFRPYVDDLVRDDALVEWLERFFIKDVIIKHIKYFLTKPLLYLNVLIKATSYKLVLASNSVPVIIKHFKAPWFIIRYEDILLDLNFELESKMLPLFCKFLKNKSVLISKFAYRIDRDHLFIVDELKALKCRKIVVKCLKKVMYECEAELFEIIDGLIDETRWN